jgi:hypothetical protein
MRGLFTLSSVLILLLGCGVFTGPDTRRVIGTIDGGIGNSVIMAPDTVEVGSSFTATIQTFGSSSCTQADGVALTLGPSEARVTPYDRVPVGKDVVCTADIAPHPHPVALSFTQVGPATIVVLGQILTPGTWEPARGTVTKQLLVLPTR